MRLEAEFEVDDETSVFEFGLAILVFIDNEGNQRYGIKVIGDDTNAATIVGVMEMVKRKLLEGT